MLICRHKTAITSKTCSMPTKWAYLNNLLKLNVLDYGCGKERDSIWLKNKGFNVVSYDPYFKPNTRINFNSIETILLNYVLNVIENPSERKELLSYLINNSKDETNILVSVRSTKEIYNKSLESNWKKYNDGFLTNRNTFQKGYSMRELIDFLKPYGKIMQTKCNYGGNICVLCNK